MGKLDEMRRNASGFVAESMGAGVPRETAERPAAPTAKPDRLAGLTRSRSAAEVPVDKIAPDPDQPREEFDDEGLDRLAESLRTRGQLQPIRVRWDQGRGGYLIVCGERRWRAARKAGMSTMTAMIVEGEIPPAELLALQLIENCLREDLKPVEQARAFRKLMDLHGWSARQLGRELNLAQTNVVRALALLDLPETVQDQVEQGALPPTTAAEIARLERPEDQTEVAREVVSLKLTREQAAAAVREKSGQPSPPRPGRSRVEYRIDGTTVIVTGPAVESGPAAIAEALEIALERARAAVRGEAA